MTRVICLYRENVIAIESEASNSLIKADVRGRNVNCGIRHVTVPIATRILIANVRHIGLSNICVINLVYFKMQV